MPIQKPRGTYDILPSEMKLRNLIDKKIREVFRNYNYKEIKTPSFEKTELFKRGIGEETDVVSKEMYSFSDNEFTLRPEMTASVIRAYLENSLYNESPVTKLYYIGNMFRSERPQAGRFREFYQFGAEIIGSKEFTSDVETIVLTNEILKNLGISGYKIMLNTIGELSERKEYIAKLKDYLSQYSNDLSETSKRRLEKNPLRILDTKDKKEKEILVNAPSLYDYLSDESKNNFNKILDSLTGLGLGFEIDYKLVRGLDYYNGLTFEFVSDELGAQSAILGGGRYDGLIGMLDGKPAPAIGFAAGYERVMMIMKKNELLNVEKDTIDIYIPCADVSYRMKCLSLVFEIRNSGIIAETDHLNRSVKSQMKEADRLNAKYVIVYGEDEERSGTLKLKKMDNGEIKNISSDNLTETLKRNNMELELKQVRPDPIEFEYELNISKKYDDVTGRDFILFNFRTVKEFRNFIYRLSIYDTIDLQKKVIKFNIEGLSAPELSLSESGQAYFNYKLFDYKNTEYTLDITKNGKTHNTYCMKIGKNDIKFTKSPASKKFIIVNVIKD